MSSAADDDVYREARQATCAQHGSWSGSEAGHQEAPSRNSDGSQDHTHKLEQLYKHGRSASLAATARPSLLNMAASTGKTASTSSTSVATVLSIKRAASDWSVAAQSSNLSGNKDKTGPDTSLFSAESRRSFQASASLSGLQAKRFNAAENHESLQDPPARVPDADTGVQLDNSADAYQNNGEDHCGDGRLIRSTSPVDPDDPDNSNYNNEEVLSWPLQGPETDPRELLRDQLRRSESAGPHSLRNRSRTHSARSMQSLSSTGTTSAHSSAERTPTMNTTDTRVKAKGSPRATKPHVIDRQSGRQARRYFVLTSAGKPVFASRPNWRTRRKERRELNAGDAVNAEEAGVFSSQNDDDPEEMLTSLVGVMQAIISLYAVENDMIRFIDAGHLKIAFYLKAPVYLVGVSEQDEPESLLRVHLEYLHLAILSITTQSSISTIFKERSNFDLRRLLAGTENILDGLLDDLQEIAHGGDFAFQVVSGALKVVPFLSGPPRSEPDSESAIIAKSVETLRDECTKALRPPRKYEGVLYALLVSHTTLVTLLRPKDHSIHPADLHILLSTIGNTDALRTPNAESWIPICMPRFNSRGFLHAFICYCNRETKVAMQQAAVSSPEEAESKGDLGLGIILITADKEGFFDMKQWKDHAFAKLFREQASYGNSAASNGHLSLYERLRYAITPWPKADVIASGEGRASKDWMLAGSGSSIPHIPPMRHFWYKSKTHVQIFSPSSHLSALATSESAGSPIGSHASRYLHIRETLHNSINRARGDGGAKLVYSVGPDEAILGLSTSNYELYGCFPPLVPKSTATEAAQALVRWVRKNESKIFLVASASF